MTRLMSCRFYYVLALPPQRSPQNTWAIAAYCFFLALTLIPTIFEEFLSWENRLWYSILLAFTLLLLLGSVVQLLGFVALGIQARETMSRRSPGSLSAVGLACQAVVFLLVGISFIFRFGRMPRIGRAALSSGCAIGTGILGGPRSTTLSLLLLRR